MRRSSWIELGFALGALLLCASMAQAQAEDPDALVARGVEMRQQGDDDGAAELFARAYELGQGTRALAQLALAEQALGRWVQAREHLGEALERGGDWVVRHRETLDASLAVIDEHVGRLEVTLDVEGATVRLNGRALETSPAYALTGEALVQVEAEGYRPAERDVVIEAGRLTRVYVPLVAEGGSAEPEATGSTAQATADPVEATGGGGAGPWFGIGTAGAVVAALALGATIGALAIKEDAAGEYNDPLACPPPMSVTCAETADRFHSARDWAIGLGVGAGVAAVAAGIAFALGASEPGASDDVALAPGPGDAGLSLEVRW